MVQSRKETESENTPSFSEDSANSSDNELQGLMGTAVQQSSQSTRTLGDSGIQMSKETIGQNSGILCGTQASVVKSEDVSTQKGAGYVGPDNHSKLLQSPLKLSTLSVCQHDVKSGLSDLEVARLGSHPLREVTDILSNLAESLYHLQSSKETMNSETEVTPLDTQPLIGVRRALSSLSSFLSLQKVESEPLSEVYRAVSQLFKIYSVRISKSESHTSLHSTQQPSQDVLSLEDINFDMDRASYQGSDVQKIALDLLEVCKSTDSLSVAIPDDRLLDILERLEVEGIHLEEANILLDLIDYVLDHIPTLAPGDDAPKKKLHEWEEVPKQDRVKHDKIFESISTMIQDTLHNVADELMYIANYIQEGHIVETKDSKIASQLGFDDTETTSKVSTDWESSRQSVDAHKRKGANSRGWESMDHLQKKVNNESKSLPTFPQIGAQGPTGVGARPKIPSKTKMEMTDKMKSKHGSSSKRKGGDSKLNDSSRISQQFSSGKVHDLSSSSNSTTTLHSEKSCDVCTSTSTESKNKSSSKSFSKRKKHRKCHRERTQVEKHHTKIETSDKFSQKPSTPIVHTDKGSSAIDFSSEPRLLTPQPSRGEETAKEDVLSSELSDIVQTAVLEIMTGIKKGLAGIFDRQTYSSDGVCSLEHTTSADTTTQETKAEKPHDESLSHMPQIVKQIHRENRGTLRKDNDKEEVKSKSDSGEVRRADDFEVMSVQVRSADHPMTLTGLIPMRSNDDLLSTPKSLPGADQRKSTSSSKLSPSRDLSGFLSDLLHAWRRISQRSESSSSEETRKKVDSSGK